jgi:hypothetical protein
VFKILAISLLTYGSETWTICKREGSRITAVGKRFIMPTAGYTCMDHKRNTEIMKELNTETIMNFLQTYRVNWKCYVLRMPCSRILFQMLHYQPNEKDPQEDPLSSEMRL